MGDHALEYMTGGLALILGKSGRNLGAGMSGGIAYVYDLSEKSVNPDSLKAGELRLEAVGSADQVIIRDLLELHASETGSPLASRMLASFDDAVTRFTKVVPRDYAAVLSIREEAEKNGVDPDGDATWQKIMEVTGG